MPREIKLPSEIRYLRNELRKHRALTEKQHEADKEIFASLDANFQKIFGEVTGELRLLRLTLVLVLLANMQNKKQRKTFLKMVDFVQDESDFQEFVDEAYDSILNTKKLKGAI